MKEDEVSVGIKGGIFLFKREKGLLKPPWNDLRFTYFSGYTCTWKIGLGGRDCFLVHYRGGGETEEGEGGTGALRYQGHLSWNIEILEKKISKYTFHLVETCVKLGSTEERTDKQYAIQMVSFLYDGLTSGGRRDLPAGVGRGEGERMMQIGSIFHPG